MMLLYLGYVWEDMSQASTTQNQIGQIRVSDPGGRVAEVHFEAHLSGIDQAKIIVKGEMQHIAPR